MKALPNGVKLKCWLTANKEGETEWTVFFDSNEVGRAVSRRLNFDPHGKPCAYRTWWFGYSTLPSKEGYLRFQVPPGAMVPQPSITNAVQCESREQAIDVLIVHSLQ